MNCSHSFACKKVKKANHLQTDVRLTPEFIDFTTVFKFQWQTVIPPAVCQAKSGSRDATCSEGGSWKELKVINKDSSFQFPFDSSSVIFFITPSAFSWNNFRFAPKCWGIFTLPWFKEFLLWPRESVGTFFLKAAEFIFYSHTCPPAIVRAGKKTAENDTCGVNLCLSLFCPHDNSLCCCCCCCLVCWSMWTCHYYSACILLSVCVGSLWSNVLTCSCLL